jgi:hypothetical protein
MAKIDFYKINAAEKAAIFTEIATQKGMKPSHFQLQVNKTLIRFRVVVLPRQKGN